MHLLTVGLCFNLRSEATAATAGARDGPEDAQAEFDTWSTVSALAETLSFGGACRVLTLPFGPDLAFQVARLQPDVVFNIAEGQRGRSRESVAPAVFELLGIPYVGSDPVALGAGMDKALAKAVVSARGVRVAWGSVAASEQEAAEIAARFPLPALVKPVAEGSSKGVRSWSRVLTPDELVRQAAWVIRRYGQPVLVEEFLPGREFSVGLVGNDPPAVLPVLEVQPQTAGPEGAFVYCYKTKQANLERFLCPAPIPAELARELADKAVAVFRALSLRDMARVDFRLDAYGLPRFLEVNPLPGMSPASLFTAQARAAGMDLQGLVARIMDAAAGRWLSDEALDPRLRRRLLELRQVLTTFYALRSTLAEPSLERG